MRLLRLELQGFKSFLDRTILNFEPGVTGVVGPNGCGKSNIVDAIMWVMGEQSPKHLRGESMTDIIFAGSEGRAPTSMAEVSLVMDRAGVPLAPAFAAFDTSDEVAVTRRIFRDGSSEFYINKTACRLKDIHELFMDTGVGRRAYSIIEQGQIDRMINVKPEDRRYLFEEVAGITKYKAKRKEAERKLEATEQNLLRIHDIITELEKQIRSLKIQATKARKFKEIKSELEVVDLHMIGKDLSLHQEAVTKLESERNEHNVNRSEWDAEAGRYDSQITELDITRIDQEKAVEELSHKERSAAERAQRLEALIAVLDERKRSLTASEETILREQEEVATEDQNLSEERMTVERDQIELEEGLRTIELEVGERESELKFLQEEKQKFQSRRDQVNNRLNQVSQKEVGTAGQISYANSRIDELRDLRVELNRRLTEVISEVEAHKAGLTQIEEKIQGCTEQSQRMEHEVAEAHTECQEISRRLSELEETLFSLREVFQTDKSRLQSLTELQENLEGYSPTAKEILLRLNGEEQGALEAWPLADLLTPDAELEELLELLLGNDLNTLVVRNKSTAEELARTIDARELERVRITSLEELGQEAAPTTEIPQGTIAVTEKVKVAPEFQAVANRFLKGVYLCERSEDLFELRTRFPNLTFICRNTRIITHGDRTLSAGTAQTRMGVFARRREMEELKVSCEQHEARLAEVTIERETLMQQLTEQEERHESLKHGLSRVHIESVELRKEREKIQAVLQRSERDYQGVMEESEKNVALMESLRGQLDLWAAEVEKLQKEKEELAGQAAQAEQEIASAVQKFDAALSIIHESKVESSKLVERVQGLKARADRISAERAGLERRANSLKNQLESEQEERAKIDTESAEFSSQIESAQTDRSDLLTKLADMKQAFSDTSLQLQELREKRDELQDKRGALLDQLQQVEVKLAHETAQLDHLKSLALERYHREPGAFDPSSRLSLEQLPLLAEQLEVTWDLLLVDEQNNLLREHLKSLKDKIERYGEVNLTAIQEFDEVQARFDFLSTQKADLENSIRILQEAIIKIDEGTKARFADTFEAVNRKFKEIFPILFNGGKAELSLTNSENMLEAGVDVMVQPPGKRFQSISLLSGGEKALCAVSLILAIFARKPSPFCLLDEVDAPLDDANVSRFNTVIRKMAEKTQFIVITHNKKTMEIAEALYGVTMERAGISKMTSVRMN